MSDVAELVAVLNTLTRAFARHNITYYITGSLASSVHGEFRATNDIDIVADIARNTLPALCRELASEFVADIDQALVALDSGASFNLIHREAYLKVDIFPCTTAFNREAARRAEPTTLPGADRPLRVATKEDILLAKLQWYRLGGETSEVQRRDIERLIALNPGAFDDEYLRRWAKAIAVDDLLAKFMAPAR